MRWIKQTEEKTSPVTELKNSLAEKKSLLQSYTVKFYCPDLTSYIFNIEYMMQHQVPFHPGVPRN